MIPEEGAVLVLVVGLWLASSARNLRELWRAWRGVAFPRPVRSPAKRTRAADTVPAHAEGSVVASTQDLVEQPEQATMSKLLSEAEVLRARTRYAHDPAGYRKKARALLARARLRAENEGWRRAAFASAQWQLESMGYTRSIWAAAAVVLALSAVGFTGVPRVFAIQRIERKRLEGPAQLQLELLLDGECTVRAEFSSTIGGVWSLMQVTESYPRPPDQRMLGELL